MTPHSPERPSSNDSQSLDFEALEPRILFDAAAPDAPVADVSVEVVEEEFINEDVNFEISFDNTGGSEGYAPYVDFVAPPELELNSVETFGAPAENPTGPAVDAIGQIAADGQLVDLATGTTPIDHPMFTSPTDGGTYGLAGSGTPPVTYDVATNPALVGMHVYSVQLPFGSFTQANPAATVQVSASLDKANGIVPHEEVVAYAQGGFAYGCDALHNSAGDTPIASGLASDGVTPLVIDLEKTAGVPEEDGAYTGENASGPNHPITYTLTVNLADGEEVDNLVIEDFLPDDLAYTGNLTVSYGASTGGTKVDTINDQPAATTDGLTATDPAGNRIRITVDNIIGGGGGDITVTYTAFVPYQEFDGTLVIDPADGEENDLDPNEYNDAKVTADYDADGAGSGPSIVIGDDEGPMNPATLYESFDANTDYRIEEHSIATQKGVEILTAGDRGVTGTLNSGDVLEYSINFQISDYFAFTDVVFDDVMADGQEFLPVLDPSSTWANAADFDTDPVALRPQFTFTMHGSSVTLTFDEANFSAVENVDGSTSIHFDLYQQLIDDSFITAGDPLLGGFIETTGTAPADLGPTNFNGGGTVGTITYHALVRDAYQGGVQAEVSQGDSLGNNVVVTGMNRDIDSFAAEQNVTDDSGSSISIPVGSVIKETINLYSHGQMVSLIDDNDPTTRPTIAVTPGDLVTYRIQYQLPISEFENLIFTDYVPQPIFDIDGAGSLAIDTSQIYDYDAVDSFQTAGRISFGPGDTFLGPDGPGGTSGIEFDNPGYNSTAGLAPTISIVGDGSLNAFEVNIGSYHVGDGNDPIPTMVELLVTLEVQDGEFAEGLFFTNQVTASEANTTGAQTNTNEISQSVLERPELTITKGVTAVDHTDGVFDASKGPVGVTFNAPGSGTAWSGGPITSDALATTAIDANLSNVDAGDVITFFVVVENTGDSQWGAFDVSLSDTIPVGMAIPSGGSNLRVTLGDGTVLNSGADYSGDLFTTPLELIDPALDQGSLEQYDGTSGRNLVVIAYDLVIESTVNALELMTNVAEVETFAALEGGADYADPDEITDDATVRVAAPAVDKTITNTSHDDTDNVDSNAEATIGEVVTYSVTIEIPEGEMSSARILDTLPAGMAFVGLDSVFASAGLSVDVGGTIYDLNTDTRAYYNADASTLELGIAAEGVAGFDKLINGNIDNSTPETITFVYRAVVLNDSNANRDDIKANDAEIRWTPPQGEQVVEDTENVVVVEPNISVDKVIVGGVTSVEGADLVTYRITVANTGTTGVNTSEAYDVVLADALPADVSYSAATLTHTLGVAPNGGTLLFDAGSGPEGTIRAQWDRLAVGESSVIEVTVLIDNGLPTDTVITNNADIEASSLPNSQGDAGYTGFDPSSDFGPNANFGGNPANTIGIERTGDDTDPGLTNNDYNDTDPAAVTVTNPLGIDKAIIDTAEVHTSQDNSAAGTVYAAIGEVVRYEVRVRLPQATSQNVQLVDTLDSRLFWVDDLDNDLEIRLEGFSNPANFVASDPLIPAADGTTHPLDPALVGFNGASNEVTFSLGNLTNNETDAGDEFIVIAYNAIVRNDGDPAARGDVLSNSVQMFEQGAAVNAPMVIDLTVVEPSLTIAKSDASTTSADAGDLIDYTITVTSENLANTTTAFEVGVLDSVPDELEIVGGVINIVGLPGTSSVVTNTVVGQDITVLIDQLNPGEDFQITFQARVRDTGADIIHSDETIENTASLSYSSLPGDGTDDTVGDNTTGNEAGTPGDPDGERQYDANASDDFTTPTPVLSKVLANPVDTDFTIGETVEYVITLDVPEGRVGQPDAFILDTIDSGFRFVPGTLSVTFDAGVTAAVVGPYTEANAGFFTHTDPGDVAMEETLRFDFDSVDFNNTGALDGLNTGTIEIRYQLKVENILANQQGDQLNNTAQFSYTDENGTTTNVLDDSTGNLDTIVDIVEPTVTVDKNITSIAATPDARDIVSYEVVLENTSALTAFDVTFRDEVPTGLTFQPTSFTATRDSDSLDVSAFFTVTPAGLITDVPGTIDLANGDKITITYDVEVPIGVRDGDAFLNEADIEWTTLDGVDIDERSGDGDLDNPAAPTNPNDYENEDTATFSADLTYGFTKDVFSSSAGHTNTAEGTNATIEDLTIGETVTFRLTANIGRGTTDQVQIFDTLDITNGLLDITNVTVTGGPALSRSDGRAWDADVVISNAQGADSYNDTVQVDFFTVVNDPDLATVATDEQIIVYVEALVVNDLANQQDDVINNAGELRFLEDTDGNGTREQQIIQDDVDVEIVEPTVVVDKSITSAPTDPNGGDTVSYEIEIRNTSGINAFDLTFQDILPSEMDLQTGTFSAVRDSDGFGVNSLFTFTADEVRHSGSGFDLAAGDFITISYDAIILSTVTDGLNLINEADVEWSSLDDGAVDGSDADERTGDGDPDNPAGALNPNNYESEDNETVVANLSQQYDFTKEILTTSAGHTSIANGAVPTMEDLTIGEQVTYVLTATIAEGTTPQVVITDTLDLANGILDIRAVRVTGGSNLTTSAAASIAAVTPTLDDSNSDTYIDNFTLNFDEVVNDASGTNPEDGQIRIEIDAVVVNVLANEDGDIINNSSTLSFLEDSDNDGSADDLRTITDDVDVELVEPEVTVTKSIPLGTTEADAGDVVGYRIIIENTSTTEAFDLSFQDVIPAQMSIDTGSFSAQRNDFANVATFFDVTAGGITQAGSGFDLDAGASITINYNATVLATVTDGLTLNNEADIEWTSLDAETADGSDADERGGDGDPDSPAAPTNPNDYESEDDAEITGQLTPLYDFDKVIFATSESHTGTALGTNASIEDLVVGETVTYELTAQMGRGTTPGVIIEDILQLSNGILDIRAVRIESGAAVSFTAPTPVITDSNTDTYMDQVSINFGSVVTDPALSSGAAEDEQIRVYIDAVVVNILDNQEGDVINNLGRLTVLEDTDNDGAADDAVVREDNVDVEIVEPTLDITKSIPAGTTEADAGDIVSYQIVIDNTSTIDAFDVTFQDILPAQMDVQTGTFTATRNSDAGDVSSFFAVTTDDINQAGTGFDLVAGDFITLTYDAIVLATVTDGLNLTNEADIEWTSTDGTNADERGGDGDPDSPAAPTNPNDYESEDDAEITGELTPLYDFTKTIYSTSETPTGTADGIDPSIEDLVVGEMVTYELTAQMGRGTTPGVVIEDFLNLTNGILDIRDVRVESGAAVSFTAPTPVITDSNTDTYMDQVSINFGTVVTDPALSSGAAEDEQIRVYIDAVVVNILDNQEGDVINNLGRLTVLEDTDNDGAADDGVVREDNVDVEIVEPDVTVTKTIDTLPTNPDAGDTVSYRIVIDNATDIDAFDLNFSDILPAQLDLNVSSFNAQRSDFFDVSSLFTVTTDDIRHAGTGFDLAANTSITITYDAEILPTVRDGDDLLNLADVEWTSIDGANADERGGDGDPDNPAAPTNPNDYEDESSQTFRADLDAVYAFTKEIASTSAGHTGTAEGTSGTIEDLVVGEVVTYRLTATIGRGTTDQVRIVDTLNIGQGLLDIRNVSVSAGGALSRSDGRAWDADIATTDSQGADTYNDTVAIDFFTVVNDASGTGADEQIVVLIEAVVVNDLENQQGDVINNVGDLRFLEDIDGDGTQEQQSITDDVDVELVEPEVTVTKSIPLGTTEADAGDVVGYRIFIENTSSTEAFDLSFQDVIPAQMSIDTGSFSAQRNDFANVATFFDVTAGGITQAGSGFDLDAGASITINYNATVLATVTDGLTLNNEADIEWTSLDAETADGSDADERGGDGDPDSPAAPTNPNDYESEDDAEITGELTPLYDFTKTIYSTSETPTGTADGTDPSIEDLVVGEMVTYELTAQMGRGTTPGVVIEDFLNLTNGILDIRDVRVESGAAVSFTAPTPVITDSNTDTYMDQVSINFGTVVTDPALSSGAAEDEQIRVYIDAVVVNILDNQEGDVINNLGRLTVLEDTDNDGAADDGVVREDNVDVEIVEPDVTVTKTIDTLPTNPDAGDTVSYRIVIDNATDIDAFDLNFSDILPAQLDLNVSSFNAQRSDFFDVSSLFTVTTDDIRHAGTGFDLAANTSITITYDAEILPTVRDGDDLLNLADVEWTSIDGANADERGGDGDPDNPAAPTNPNDYEDESSQTFRADLDAVYAFTKEIASTSAGHTGTAEGTSGTIEDLVVGEVVTYRLTATIGRGTTDQVRIVDTLNIGQGLLDIRNVSVSAGGALSRSDGRAWDADIATTDSQGADTYNDTVAIDFFTVVNDASGTGADEQIVVLIEAVVVNDLENQQGDVINNVGDLRFLEDIDGDGTQEQQSITDDVDVELVEPEVTVTKSIPLGTTEADAGDVVGYRIFIENTSSTEAFDLSFQDVIPAQMSIDTGSFSAQRNDFANVATFFDVTAGGITQAGSGFDLDAGASITINYNATVLATVTDGLTLNNEADIEWTSLDAETADGSDADERGGDGDPDSPAAPTNPNDYESEDDAEITGELTPLYDFTKTIYSTSETPTGTADGTDPSIEDLVVGEMVTYELTAQMGRGTTPGVVIEDFLNLSNGILDIRAVRIESGAAVSFTAPTPVITDSNTDTYDDQVSINFGTVVTDPALSSGAAEDEQIRVYIDAVVVNILDNQEGDVINNLGRLTVLEDTDNDGAADDAVVREDNVDVEIVEPDVTVTKTIDTLPTNPDAGDTVSYRIVIDNATDIDAFDLNFSDILPAQLDLNVSSFNAQRSDFFDVSSLFTVTTDDIRHAGSGFDLAANTSITITYDAEILPTVRDGDDLLNLADVEWTSIDGANADERGGDGDPDNPAAPTNPDDYEDESSQTFRADLSPVYAFTKEIASTSAGHTGTAEGTSGTIEDLVVGEVVTYRLTATIGRGTTDQVRIVDTLNIGQGLLDIRNVSVSAGGALSRSDGRAWDADIATTDSQGADTYNDTVAIDFFTVVNDASGTGADEQIVVLIEAVVVNDLENQQGDVINNVGDLRFLQDTDGDGTQEQQSITDDVDVELVEPEVTVLKETVSAPTDPNAGDTVSYRITLANNSGVDAFDLTFQDTLPAEMDLQIGTFSATHQPTGFGVNSRFSWDADSIVQAGAGFDLANGESIIITYDTIILPTVTDGLNLINDADVEWTSLDSATADGSDADERGGDGDFANPAGPANPNDYENEDDQTVVANLSQQYDFTKEILTTSAAHTTLADGTSPTIEDLTIGEQVTYVLTASIGEGTTPQVVISDALDLANGVLDIRAVRVSGGSNLTTTAGPSIGAVVPTLQDLNSDTYTEGFVLDFATVVNDATGTNPEDGQIRIEIDAVVVNVLDNQDGDVVTNTGTLSFLEDGDNDGSADDLRQISDMVDVELVEPTVTVAKSIPLGTTEADAGDVVVYQIVITNTSDHTAFDVTFQDIVPTPMDISTTSFTATRDSDGGDVSSFFAATTDNIFSASSGFDLASGDFITITYNTTVLATVTDGLSLLNEADVEWTSLDADTADGSDADERGGDGDPDNPAGATNPNDYEAEDDAEITGQLTPLYDFDKVIFATSESHTGTALGTNASIEDLVVGETVTYELTAQMGRGTTPGVVIEDFLNLSNGILDIRDVRIESGAAVSFTAPTPVVTDSNTDTYMDQVSINFGTVVTDPALSSGAAEDEQIRVYIDAVVVNILDNQEGDVINNLGRLTVLEDTDNDGAADDAVVREDNVDVEIVEPTLDVTKSIPAGTTEADAGDIVSYQIVIDNTSTIDAFDVTFQDILPSQMDVQTGTFTATRNSDAGDVSSFFAVTANDINQAGTGFDLVAGDFITLTYDTIVLATVTDGASLLNGVDIEWTSTSGTNADERGGDGDPDSPAAPTNPNDYESEDDAEITGELTPLYDFDKVIFATSESHTGTALGTNASIEDLVVGETVTYELTAQMGRGTTPGVVIEDFLNLSNGILDIRDVRIESGAAVSFTAPTPVVTDSNTDTYMDQVSINFGTVVTDPALSSGAAEDEQIRVYIDAVVVNILDNQEGDVINNLGRLTVLEDTDNDGAADDAVVREDNVDVEIVEPTLDVTKSIPAGTTEADAGDIVSYQIVIDNTSTIDAFDVTFQDILPSQMDVQTGTFTATRNSDAGDVSSFFAVTANDINQAGTGFDLVAGDFITLTYDTIVLATVTDGASLLNGVDIEWTSTSGTNADERGGDGDPDSPAAPTNPNDYESEDDAEITGELTPLYDFDKVIFATSESHTGTALGTDTSIEDLVVGETVTYELTAQMGRGTTPGVIIEDFLNLSNGILDIRDVRIESGAAVSFTAPTPVVTDSNTDTYMDQVRIDFGTVVTDPALSSGAAEDEQIRVYIDAVVVNILDNQEGDVINNLGRLTVLEDTDNDGAADDAVVREDNVDVEIVEPELTTTKTVTSVPDDPDAADTVSYEVVIENATALDAFDVTFLDTLPAEMRTSGSLSAVRVSDGNDVSAFFTISPDGTRITHSGSGFDLIANDRITLTYNARITEAVLDGQILTNEVDTEWTSTPGTNADERGGDGDPDNPAGATNPNDYESEDDASIEANLLGYDFDKSIFATSETHTDQSGGLDNTIEDLVVGETVTYALTATFAEGTTLGVLIEDDISIAEGLLDVESVAIVGGSNMSSSAGAFSSISVSLQDRNGDGHNEYIIADLGSVINNATDGANPEADQITVYVTARVVNVIENQEGDVVRNDAVFTFLEDENGDNIIDGSDIPTEITDSEVLEILEPTLTVEKSVNNEKPKLREVLTYTLQISNVTGVSTTDAFDLVIDDELTRGLQLIPGSVTLNVLGTPTNPSTIVTDTSSRSNIELAIDRLDEGESIEITYKVRVTDNPSFYRSVLPNDVDLTWTSTPGTTPGERGGDPTSEDPTNPNDYDVEDREVVVVHQPDLRIEKTDFGQQIRAGQNFNYTMIVTNQGRAKALDVSVSDDIAQFLREGFTFVGGSHGAALAGTTVNFTLPDIAVGGKVNVTLTLRAPAAIPAGLELINNTAVVDHLDVEPSPGDNTDDEDTPINAVPDLVVTKDDGLTTATIGEEVTYHITFENVGTQTASGVFVRDTLPPGVEFISASDGGRLVNGVVVWDLGEVTPGESGSFSIQVKVLTAGLKVNVVTINDDGRGGPDPTPGNNRDVDETTGEVAFSYNLNSPTPIGGLPEGATAGNFGSSNGFGFGTGNPFSSAYGSKSQFGDRFGTGTRSGNELLPGSFGMRDQLGAFDFIDDHSAILVPTHMNSGLAQPGSTITIEVYNARGERIGDTSVVADTGGNWLATFPMSNIDSEPTHIVMRQTWAAHNDGNDTGYNFRTYFAPLASSGFYSEELSIYNVTGKRAATEVIDLYESCAAILNLDWNGHSYEYHVLSSLPSGSGN